MKATTVGRLLVALAAIALGVVCWFAAGIAEGLAVSHERLATLRADESSPPGRWRTFIEGVLDPQRTTTASILVAGDYWAGRYDSLSADTDKTDDPAALRMAADALYRKASRAASGRPLSVEGLDQAAQAYVSVLKNAGFDRDVAYNYEFVTRLRDSIARAKGTGASRTARIPAPPPADDLPSGPTIHGRPGVHPPNTRGEEFEVITPMDYGDREAQPEATPGRPLPRKG